MNTLERLTVAGITITALLGAQHEWRWRQPIELHATTLVERIEHPVSDAGILLHVAGVRYHGENGETYCLKSRELENTKLAASVRYDPIIRCYRTISF